MSKTLFIGLGNTAPSWYRCGLPAIYMGKKADWVGFAGNPEEGAVVGGSLDSTYLPEVDEYDTIIVQQPGGDEWLKTITEWRDKDKTVIYECDDFLHGVRKVPNHINKGVFHKKRLKEYESCMKACNGMILSTERLAEYYKKYNDNQAVCLVALDTTRYNIKFGPREWVCIGWAGGTGHEHAIEPWLGVVSKVMMRNPNVSFCSIGSDYARIMSAYHPHRCLSIPWVSIENLPYALSNIDIAIAPAHESKYHLAKSDLRWLEASAIGLPVVADPRIYGQINDGTTGIIADSLEDAEDELEALVYSESDRHKIGQGAKEYVQEHRDIRENVSQWERAIESICQA